MEKVRRAKVDLSRANASCNLTDLARGGPKYWHVDVVAPSNRDALPKPIWKFWIHCQKPNKIHGSTHKIHMKFLGLSLKTKLPIRVCTRQTKILGSSLDLAHEGLGFLYGTSSKAKLYTFRCNRLFQTRGAHCIGEVLRTGFIPCSF